MLEDGRHSLDTVARETGFADRDGCGGPSCVRSVSPPRSSSGTPVITSPAGLLEPLMGPVALWSLAPVAYKPVSPAAPRVAA